MEMHFAVVDPLGVPLMADASHPLGTDAEFRFFVDTVEEYAIFMMSVDGKMVTWNAGVGRILGYSEEEFLGQHSSLIFTPEDLARGVPALEMKTALAAGRAENERWHVRKDGSRFWGLGVMKALRDPRGELVGFAKIMRDRTDLKELQETLRSRAEALVTADQKKNLFLATLAHELRSPLGAIANAAQVIRLQTSSQPDLEQPTGVIERQVRHIRRLVDDLLDVARLSAGKVELCKESIDLAAVLRQAVETIRPMAESRKHELLVTTPSTPVHLQADPARLQQVFVNLLSNACKYTDEGGHVWVNATVEGDEAVVRVRDDGMGMSADLLPRVFELFTQDDAARQRAQGGLGIGLSLVKSLVSLHGGTVQIRSDGPGKGSEFTVRLPMS
jgi:PAS domain S-box-containing protein